MKVLIVLSAVIAIASAGAVRSGWGAPPNPSIDLELAGAAAATGAGQAAGNQQVLELASGNALQPGQIVSSNGVNTAVGQGEVISQVEVASLPSGATSTIQAIDVNNYAVATDDLIASVIGANAASVNNNGATDVSGQGAIAAEGASYNNVDQGRR